LVDGLKTQLPTWSGWGQLAIAATTEVAVGGIMALGMLAAFGAFSVAGKLIDVQSGLGLGGVYDPVTRGGAPLFATLFNLVGVATFFALDGHHALLRGVAYSLAQLPPGAGLSLDDATPLLRLVGLMFELGVALIAPVMLCLLLVEIVLAVSARVLPQMNVFVVAAPVKLIAAMAVLASAAPALGPAVTRVHAAIFRFWEQVL
jgi:flagellar biosynthetic protein FliR